MNPSPANPIEEAQSLESLKDLWSTFARSFVRLTGQTQIQPHDEASFLEIKNAFFDRYKRIRSITLETALESGSVKIESLEGLTSLSSLTDDQVVSCRRAIQTAGQELDTWMERLNRMNAFRRKGREHSLRLFVIVPVSFAVLLGLFVVLGLRFFLNR